MRRSDRRRIEWKWPSRRHRVTIRGARTSIASGTGRICLARRQDGDCESCAHNRQRSVRDPRNHLRAARLEETTVPMTRTTTIQQDGSEDGAALTRATIPKQLPIRAPRPSGARVLFLNVLLSAPLLSRGAQRRVARAPRGTPGPSQAWQESPSVASPVSQASPPSQVSRRWHRCWPC